MTPALIQSIDLVIHLASDTWIHWQHETQTDAAGKCSACWRHALSEMVIRYSSSHADGIISKLRAGLAAAAEREQSEGS